MEAMVKKYQQRFRKVRDEMDRWSELQSRLISQFRNASSIIQRLQVLRDSKKYVRLKDVVGIQEAVLAKQMESLQKILFSMNKTMEEFHGIVLSLGKIHRDGRQMVKGGGSNQLTIKQLQQRVGVKPSLADCLDGLMLLQEMHCSEYLLKSSVVSALSALTLKPSASDLGALQQLLVDQPNIPNEEGDTFNMYMKYCVSPSPTFMVDVIIISTLQFNSSLISYLQKKTVDVFCYIGCKLRSSGNGKQFETCWCMGVHKRENSKKIQTYLYIHGSDAAEDISNDSIKIFGASCESHMSSSMDGWGSTTLPNFLGPWSRIAICDNLACRFAVQNFLNVASYSLEPMHKVARLSKALYNQVEASCSVKPRQTLCLLGCLMASMREKLPWDGTEQFCSTLVYFSYGEMSAKSPDRHTT
ncbi:unnamed protein product [Prunus armeniaca]|uniref:Uncharacterized protein n=1 Tax=Prunus armeniaca TaxID=36596 RepID=A0A6J5UUI9_PRUAR|nr:unnamed protein product [Prunus armeniaca]